MYTGLFPQKPHTIRGVTCLNMRPIEEYVLFAEKAFDAGLFLRALLLCEALVYADEFGTMTLYLQAQTFSFLARSAHNLNLQGFGLNSATRALELYQQFQETVVDPITRAGAQTVVDAFANGELRQRIFSATVIICHAMVRAEKSIAAWQVGDSYLTVAEQVSFLKRRHSNGCLCAYQIDSRMESSLRMFL